MTTDETLTADLDWLRDHRHLTGPTLYRYASVYKQFALWLGHCPLGQPSWVIRLIFAGIVAIRGAE